MSALQLLSLLWPDSDRRQSIFLPTTFLAVVFDSLSHCQQAIYELWGPLQEIELGAASLGKGLKSTQVINSLKIEIGSIPSCQLDLDTAYG